MNKRLGPLLSLAVLKESEAIKAMVQARTQKAIEDKKLEQLEEFRKQYLESTQKDERQGIGISRLLENRSFLNRNAKAIREQEKQISVAENQISARSDEWKRSRHTKIGFEKLIDHENRSQTRFQEKREQSEIDDHSRPEGEAIE